MNEALIIKLIGLSLSPLSIIFSLAMLIHIFSVASKKTFKRLKSDWLQLLSFLSYTDILCSCIIIGQIVILWDESTQIPREVCQILGSLHYESVSLYLIFDALESFATQYAFVVSNAYYVAVSVYSGLMIKGLITAQNFRFQKRYHLLIWLFPLLLAIIPLIPFSKDVTYDRELWCWLLSNPTKGSILARIFLYYAPSIIGMFIIICVNTTTAVNLTRIKFPSERDPKLVFRRLFFYPVAFVILFLPGMIHRCYELFNIVLPIEIMILHSIALSSHGIVNGIIYFVIVCFRDSDRRTSSEFKMQEAHLLEQ
eukprot:TRINITY_DN2032_c0_g3_i2.p1 TRINITY_DN2032_c0_g3~~TRINITY_DN2032_c0_g3_i2.p1  ORF type:complete len:311 (+),score=3.49 TRINITY_DN2032_c0_g3_i2:55-987(+)